MAKFCTGGTKLGRYFAEFRGLQHFTDSEVKKMKLRQISAVERRRLNHGGKGINVLPKGVSA